MTSEGLVEIFKGDFADTCTEKIPLVSMGGRADGQACADPGARTPIGTSGISYNCVILFLSILCGGELRMITFTTFYNNIFILNICVLSLMGDTHS